MNNEFEIKVGDLIEIETDNGQFYHGNVIDIDLSKVVLEDVECNTHNIARDTIYLVNTIDEAEEEIDIIAIVRGGVLVSIYSNEDMKVRVLDWDEVKEDPKLEKAAEEIMKRTKSMKEVF